MIGDLAQGSENLFVPSFPQITIRRRQRQGKVRRSTVKKSNLKWSSMHHKMLAFLSQTRDLDPDKLPAFITGFPYY